MDKEEVFKHESYGIVGLSRQTGGIGRLFGSALGKHDSCISLTIRPAERIHSLSEDRYFGGRQRPFIEVHLSPAQFADMVTGMNVGEGVPCTVRWLDGKRMEDPPELPTEVEKVRTNFDKEMKEFGKKVGRDAERVQELLAQKTLKKADRDEIRGLVFKMAQEVQSNIPFVLSQFAEASQRVVTHAKAEVEAFVSSAVRAAGLENLQKKLTGGGPTLPQLGEGEDD